MTQIRNVSGDDRTVPGLGGRLVMAGQVVEVPDDEANSYTEQTTNWETASAESPKQRK